MESPEGASQGMDTQEEDTQAELPNSTNGLEEAYIDAQRLALQIQSQYSHNMPTIILVTED